MLSYCLLVYRRRKKAADKPINEDYDDDDVRECICMDILSNAIFVYIEANFEGFYIKRIHSRSIRDEQFTQTVPII